MSEAFSSHVMVALLYSNAKNIYENLTYFRGHIVRARLGLRLDVDVCRWLSGPIPRRQSGRIL